MASAERPTLLNVHGDVRREILCRALAFEPDREVVAQSQGFPAVAWNILRHTMEIRSPMRLRWFGIRCEDDPMSNIFPLQRAPHKHNEIFRVCKQLHLEASDLFFKVNGFITIRVDSGHFKLLRQHFPDLQRWNTVNPPCQPVIQVIVSVAGHDNSETIVIPAVDLHMLGPALHLLEGAQGGPWHLGTVLLQFASERRMCNILQCKDREALLRRLENDLLFWIGHGVNGFGTSIEGADENGKSSLTSSIAAYNQKLKDMTAQKRFAPRVKRMGNEFREAYATSAGDGTFLDIKDKILCLARAHKQTDGNHAYPAMKHKLDCMLGFEMYTAAGKPALDQATARWQLWCANRALSLPSFFPDEGWKLRLEAQCIVLLSRFPDLQRERLWCVESVVGSLTPIDTQLRMEVETLKNWVNVYKAIPGSFRTPEMYIKSREANREMMSAFGKVHDLLVQRIFARFGDETHIPQQALVTSEWK